MPALIKRVGAWRRLAEMGARFKCDIGCGTLGPVARLRQSDHLSVWSAAWLCRTPADNNAVMDDNAAYTWIGIGLTQSALAERDRMSLELFVQSRLHDQSLASSVSGRRLMNSSKSTAVAKSL